MEELSIAAAKAVGIKQTTRALIKGRAQEVFVAADADGMLTKPVADLCKTQGVTCTQVAAMQELGKACGIHVGAAAAAILKN